MERDQLGPPGGSFHPNRESSERLLEQPSRFKSLHRPRASSTSSCTSQPEEDIAASAHLFPDDRGRKSSPPHDPKSYGDRAGYVAVEGASQLWIPIWLSKIVLICFLLLFAALLTALLLVWYANNQRNGFYVAASTSPYTWTYGPTAVLVILISLWRRLDYHSKTLTPWQECE